MSENELLKLEEEIKRIQQVINIAKGNAFDRNAAREHCEMIYNKLFS